MDMSPMEFVTENHCAAVDQEQFCSISLSAPEVKFVPLLDALQLLILLARNVFP
jgi:hypothetical protein